MQYTIPLWKEAPFLRLLIPFIAGLFLQDYFHIPLYYWLITIVVSAALFLVFVSLSLKKKFTNYWLSGIPVNLFFVSLGAIIFFKHSGHNDPYSILHNHTYNYITLTLNEPLVEKSKSYKSEAAVELLENGSNTKAATGNVIVYFSKDNGKPPVEYGSRIIVSKPLQPIKNSGNPGCFDYERYCAFQQIFYQVFLKPGDYAVLEKRKKNSFQLFLITIREGVTGILQKYITGKKEAGLAEALLIGYKQDLDKELVQSYTNTGVVHVIAISGLHLGIIYLLLTLLLKPLASFKAGKYLTPVLVIILLWLFAIASGGSPSVLRSAVMFSCIVVGKAISKNSTIYNTLASSALLLLCYNPFWLWDIGFQLSYTAVLSIVIFANPIYNIFPVQNKLPVSIWRAASVTIAAQILTTPLSVYHFHQFPVFFLVTNILVVPISSIVLIGEIILCGISFIKPLAVVIGKLITWMVWLMNTIIERIDNISFSPWDSLQISAMQMWILYMLTAAITLWLIQKEKKYFFAGLCALLAFVCLRTFSFYEAAHQKMLIVYNVPQMQAIDIVNGRRYKFTGNEELLNDDFLKNFHLKPFRVLHRISNDNSNEITGNILPVGNKKVILINNAVNYVPCPGKIKADIIILSRNAKVNIDNIISVFDCPLFVFDSSNTDWKIETWKKDCARLHQKYFSVKDEGAFEYNY